MNNEDWRKNYIPIVPSMYLKQHGCKVPVGIFVREYLMHVHEDYLESIYRALKREMDFYGCGQKKPSYASFRTYMHVLRRLGLIEYTREEPLDVPGLEHLKPKRYVRVNKDMYAEDDLWANPFAYIRSGEGSSEVNLRSREGKGETAK